MVIARDRYLDDGSRYHLTLELRTRTGEMHSLLGGLPAEAHERIGQVLVGALGEIAALLAPAPSIPVPRETSSFGCGT